MADWSRCRLTNWVGAAGTESGVTGTPPAAAALSAAARMAASGSAASLTAGVAARLHRAATVALTRAVSDATVRASESTAALPVFLGGAGGGSGAAGQNPASSESSRAVSVCTARCSESTVEVGTPCPMALADTPPARAVITSAVRMTSRIGLLFPVVGEPRAMAPMSHAGCVEEGQAGGARECSRVVDSRSVGRTAVGARPRSGNDGATRMALALPRAARCAAAGWAMEHRSA